MFDFCSSVVVNPYVLNPHGKTNAQNKSLREIPFMEAFLLMNGFKLLKK